MKLFEEFLAFLKEYRVTGLAAAFVIGVSVNDLVSATVDDLIMPVIEVFLPGGSWETAVLELHGVEFGAGHFVATFLDFLIVAFLVFLVAHYLMAEEDLEKL